MATFSLSDTARRAQATGNNSAGPFSFSFQVNAQTDLQVYVDSTLKTLTTHYTVSLSTDGTGSVSFTSGNHPTDSQTITILSDVPVLRTSVYTSGGNITAASLESDFDTQTMMLGDREERESRTVMAPVNDPTSVDMTLPAKASRLGTVLGFNATSGNPEAGPKIADVSSLAAITADISTLADIEDGTDASNAIQTVAAQASNIASLGPVSSNISTLGTSDAVADMNTLAAISSNISTVAGISSSVSSVAGVASLITSDFVSDLNTLATSDIVSDLNTLATSDIVSDLNTLATSDIVSDLNTLATSDIVTDMNLLATSQVVADMAALAGSGGAPNVSTVNISNITLTDNSSTSLQIKEGSNNYLTFNTTNGSEKLSFGSTANPTFEVNGSFNQPAIAAATSFFSQTYSGASLIATNGTVTIESHAADKSQILLNGGASDDAGNVVGQTAITSGFIDFAGNIRVVGQSGSGNGNTAIGDNAGIKYTSAEGLILTGQGSTNDVTIKNKSDADVLEIPTGTTNVTIAGNLGVGGTVTGTGTSVFASLDISGDIDVDGTTNLDVVDIDGAVDMASTLTVGGTVTANAGVVVDNITIDGTEIDLSSGDLTIDVAGDIILDADGGDIFFNDAGTTFARFQNNSGDLLIESKVSDKDMIFKGVDGGAIITALTLDMSEAGNATFNGTVTASTGGSGTPSFTFAGDTNTGMFKTADDTIGFTTGGTERVQIGSFGVAADQIVNKTSSGDLTIDVAGDIVLDADGGDVRFKDNGTEFGTIYNTSSSLGIASIVQNKDIIFQGFDDSSLITALTLDMSEAGAATFNDAVGVGMAPDTAVKLSVSGAIGPTNGSESSPTYTFYSDADTGMFRAAANTLGFSTGGTERMRIHSTDSVQIGGSTNLAKWFNANGTYGTKFIVDTLQDDTDANYMTGAFTLTKATTAPAYLALAHNRGSSYNAVTSLAAGDGVGAITFQGADGTTYLETGRIESITRSGFGADSGTAAMEFYVNTGSTGVTKKMTLKSTGDLELENNLVIGTAGKGIDFSAQTPSSATGASTTSELLDHYEEGTWTPVITPEGGSAAGITVNHATYTKVGRLVSLVFDVTINSISGTSSSAAIELTGMPFNSATAHGGGPNIAYGNLTGSMTGTLALNGNTTSKYRIVNLDGSTALNASDHLQATSRLEGQFTYHTT